MGLEALEVSPPTSDKADTPAICCKTQDPYIFTPAEWFFKEIADGNPKQPHTISYEEADQQANGTPLPVSSHGRIFHFNDKLGVLLIQFMRPRVWRIRFNSTNTTPSDFSDYNTRTIVQDTLTKTIKILDLAEDLSWHVELVQPNDEYYVLQSVLGSESVDDSSREVIVQLWIERNPINITAVRAIRTTGIVTQLPMLSPISNVKPELVEKLKIYTPSDSRVAVIWRTKNNPLQWLDDATVLSIEKPLSAKYTGFGEQGGRKIFKDNVCMNYFNFDNMRYFNVYGQDKDGPFSDSEPLYHSEPYWIEMNAHPGAQSQLATFVDNYSDVKLDLGRVDATQLRIATRFNSFQSIFIAGDDVAQVIHLYMSLIGRPRLKPRFVLGNHQGCYGYDTQKKVENTVNQYRKYQIPLDGMHIDVDVQRLYRTFSINTDEGHFPQPKEMFSQLRKQGVKCGTNITPVISLRPDPKNSYSTLDEGLKNKHFVMDRRDTHPSARSYDQQISLNFGGGNRYFKNPNNFDDLPKYEIRGDYQLENLFNKDPPVPFRGGVDYGGGRGAPGHYPNLNNQEVRDWWGRQYTYLFQTGLEFVWQDMTSPCMAETFGDMKSWPFRLLLDSDGWCGDPKSAEQKKAIEIWSLYSYNLHKATFHGLQKLESRKGKRNFIIGRGSFAGAQRFAGLWTGDNASTWEFLDISVAQVLALGLAGVTIAGADVGGFEPAHDGDTWADPELVIRWYCAYSLLPWFRNHYSGKEGRKHFQEPYAFAELQNSPDWRFVPEEDRNTYYSVLPICRYVIQLRYSLLQLLYDAMFENMISSLPIARAMFITDPLDSSLYQANQWYARSQYLVRNDLLVAPALYKESQRKTRKLYLPAPDDWYPMNLRPGTKLYLDGVLAQPLAPRVSGGTYVDFDCHISPDEKQLPYATPMYIREGGIIPQMAVRDWVPDRTRDDKDAPPNPLTINVYPGKDNSYDMYLDDGVSRESAPDNVYLSALPNEAKGEAVTELAKAYGDPEAKNIFRHVKFEQTTAREFGSDQMRDIRKIRVSTPFSQYGDDLVERDIGEEYRLVVWHASRWPAVEIDLDAVKVKSEGNVEVRCETDKTLRATVAWIPVSATADVTIDVSCPA